MKIFWLVLFYNLLAFGLFCLTLILHPAEIKAILVADLDKVTVNATQEIQNAAPEFAKKTPPPKATPPPAKVTNDIDKIKPASEGIFTGDYLQTIEEKAPPPELYPLSISKRQYLEDGSMVVDLFIKNDSGFHFVNALVVLRSEDYPRPQGFQIPEWRFGEVGLFRYKFPKEDMVERLTNLRVRLVKGEILDSPLTESMRKDREKMHRELLGEANINPDSGEKLNLEELDILIPSETAQIPFEMTNRVSAVSEKDRVLVDSISETHELALEVQELMMKFVNDINNDGFEKSIVLGDGLKLRDEIKSKQLEFSKRLSQILLLKSRNSTTEVDFTASIDELSSFSATLKELASLIDIQIPIDKYKIQSDMPTTK